MQRNASVDDEILLVFRHCSIHLLVHQPERQGLIPHQRLVVRLSISDGLHVGKPVGHGEEELVHVPLLISLVFQHLNPEIGQSHSETVIEADASILNLCADSRHSAHIFSYCNILIINIMNEFVGQLQICHSIVVDVIAEIFPRVIERLTNAVILIQHRGHAIETVAVEMIFLKPITHIRQQKLQSFGLSIVEKLGVPLRVFTVFTWLKILIFSAIEEIYTFTHVFHRMRMNQVHNHEQSHAMSGIHEFFQFFRRTET